ncbi:hypothetical protein ACSVH2_12970 [Flavobacterium sp. RSB2_4_14]|uniref:hypothetical protein n=1 Tax=Flavobacterium sp. RSB2_4_14 TaxID=3447665 RepID=UPI003F342A1A
MKLLLSFFFFVFSFLLSAQHSTISKNSFLRYDDYKRLKEKKEVNIDSLGFRIFNNDTLVEITPLDRKGVSVPYEYKDSIFLNEYKKLVYNRNNQKLIPTRKVYMRHWKTEIKVYFDSTVTYTNKRELIKFFKYLDEEIDSLKISVVNAKSKSNYFIYFMNKPTDINWEERIKPTNGYYIYWDGKQRIYNGTLKLDTQKIFNQKQQITTLKKDFLFSLGNFYSIQNSDCKSYFSTCFSVDKELTEKDIELLKYHYSYGICKGTDLETFEENHRSAQERMKTDPKVKMEFLHPTE